MIRCDKIWSVVRNLWKIHPGVSTYYQLWQNMTRFKTCIEMSPLMTKPNQGATTCPKMSHLMWQNKTRCFKMTFNITRYDKTWPSMAKHDQVWQNVFMCYQVVKRRTKQDQAWQNMTRCDKTFKSVTMWWREGRGSRRASPCWHCCGPTCLRCGPCGPNLFFEPFLGFLIGFFIIF
jgi:hypothetical protein